MYINEISGRLEAIGCPSGLNWWVRYDKEEVKLEFSPEQKVVVPIEVWCQAVIKFSDDIASFYFQDWPKTLTDDFDQEWLSLFIEEWRRRRTQCGA